MLPTQMIILLSLPSALREKKYHKNSQRAIL